MICSIPLHIEVTSLYSLLLPAQNIFLRDDLHSRGKHHFLRYFYIIKEPEYNHSRSSELSLLKRWIRTPPFVEGGERK